MARENYVIFVLKVASSIIMPNKKILVVVLM